MKSGFGILVSSVLFVILFSSVHANSSAIAQTNGIPSLSGDDIARANSIAVADERVELHRRQILLLDELWRNDKC